MSDDFTEWMDWVFDPNRKPGDRYNAPGMLEAVTRDWQDFTPDDLSLVGRAQWEARTSKRVADGQAFEHAEAEALQEIVDMVRGVFSDPGDRP